MSRARRLGALLCGAAALSALVACGGGSEGTVVAKADQGVYDYGCQAGRHRDQSGRHARLGVVRRCPKCWRLVVQDNDGNTYAALREPCGVRPHAAGRLLARADRPGEPSPVMAGARTAVIVGSGVVG